MSFVIDLYCREISSFKMLALSKQLVRQYPAKFSRSLSTQPWDFDVLISGGGVVGAAFAADLLNQTKSKCKIGIIENKPPAELKLEKSLPDIRVYALSPKSIDLLDKIGAWKYIKTRSHPYTEMQVWETSGPGMVRFNANEMGEIELGRTCEDVTIQSALYQAMKDAGHTIEFIYGSSVTDIKIAAGDMSLVEPARVTISKNKAPGSSGSPEDHRTVTTRFVVDLVAFIVLNKLSFAQVAGWRGRRSVCCAAAVRHLDLGLGLRPGGARGHGQAGRCPLHACAI